MSIKVRDSDIKIVEILMRDARTPYTRIAEVLGVTEAAVRRRVRRLEEAGVIRRYTIDVDPKKIGYEVEAIIGLDVEPERIIDALDELKAMREVVRLYAASGDHVIIAECWLRTSDDLRAFVKRLESMKGVKRVCPAIVLERIK
ncbi:transcriptional regulator [Candidatus Geothermarchaeota archaeon ex4572_27]|nr:MAG: transcriptional regulator [Candidatus Geothermarchaeota archaeon ex4572_27]